MARARLDLAPVDVTGQREPSPFCVPDQRQGHAWMQVMPLLTFVGQFHTSVCISIPFSGHTQCPNVSILWRRELGLKGARD